jgi:hypothetical protein
MSKERPILFSGAMVRAILNGTKTQTRRIGKYQMDSATELAVETSMHATKGLTYMATYRAFPDGGSARWGLCECPYGIIGDKLWVRETFRLTDSNDCACYDPCNCKSGLPVYRADCPCEESKWKPSIFMPRWASRITLEITGVRVERLNDISEEDALAEGAMEWWSGMTRREQEEIYGGGRGPIGAYKDLWFSINGKGSWELNPYVWCISFNPLSPAANK